MLQQKSFQDKNILILGYGKSGVSAKNLLMPFAKNIFVYDKSFLIKILENKSENNLFLNQNNNFNNILTKKQNTTLWTALKALYMKICQMPILIYPPKSKKTDIHSTTSDVALKMKRDIPLLNI